MTLYLIGLGLYDEKDMTSRGIAAAKACDVLYLENYTSLMKATAADFEKLLGKKIIVAGRELVEQSEEIITAAKEKNVAVLVVGDPLTATTHHALLLEARKKNIRTEIIHNASIFSAVAATGLQLYKFGKMATVPFPEPGFRPESYYYAVRQNQTLGLHTLLLLDVKPEQKKFMTASEAMALLQNIEEKTQLGVMLPETRLVACARLGWPEQKIVFGTPAQIKAATLPLPPHALVVPGQLHFAEEEALQGFAL